MPLNKDTKNVAIQIAQAVHDAGGRTFYVGGYVRDVVLNRPNKDIDIEIYGIEPNQLREILSSIGVLDERKVGDNFGIFAIKGYDIDIALPRSEKPTGGGGHKDFVIDIDPYIGPENAAKRRDFTINALMQDVLTGEILDYFGGIKDLKNKVIRHIDGFTFKDDPLRIFRAAQFAARFGFKIDDETIKIASDISVKTLSRERVAKELDKALLKAEHPSVFFRELRRMDKLRPWFDEIADLIDVNQDPVHHPEGDVFEHTMMVLDEAAKVRDAVSDPRLFMVAALCHDFGKAEATKYNEEKQKWQAIGHDVMGVPIAKKFVRKLYNETDMERYVENMTNLHMRPLSMLNNHASKKKFMFLFNESINGNDLIYLNKCDHMGRAVDISFSENEKILRDMLSEYERIIKTPYITGKELIELGYEPGPKFSEMLAYARKNQLSEVDKELCMKQLFGQFGRPQENNISRNSNKAVKKAEYFAYKIKKNIDNSFEISVNTENATISVNKSFSDGKLSIAIDPEKKQIEVFLNDKHINMDHNEKNDPEKQLGDRAYCVVQNIKDICCGKTDLDIQKQEYDEKEK